MKLLLQALDATPSALIIIDRNGVIVEANHSTTELFGYEKSELIGSAVEILLPTSVRKKHKQHTTTFFEQPINRKMGHGKVFRGRKKDGAIIHVQVGINAFSQDDKMFGVANIIDVTAAFKMQKLIDRTQEAARIGSWQVDLKTNKCIWSKMTYQIHELDESQEVLVEDGINFYALEYRPVIRRYVEEGISKGLPWDAELKIITTTGKEKWVRAVGTPVVENDQVVGLEGTFQDIHEKMLLDVQREDLLSKLQRTEKLAKIGHWQWTLEPEKIEWSENLYRLWGLDLDEPVPSIERHTDWIVEEDHAVFFSSLQEGIEKKQAYAFNFKANIHGEIKHLRAEGSPIFDLNKQHVGFFGTVQDMSEQALAQQKMRSVTNRLTLALQASKVGIWEWVIPTNQLIWDKQMYALYGLQSTDFGGAYEAWVNGLHPEDRDASQTLIEQVLAGNAKFDTEFRVVWPDGTVRFIRALATLEYGRDKQPERLIGVNWDITNIKDYERDLLDTNVSLERANEELMQFAYRSSHDLKAPLIAIRALSDIMTCDLQRGDHEEVKQNIAFIKDQAIMLETLVNDLLDLAKADVITDKQEDLDFDSMLDEVIRLNQSLARVNKVKIVKSIELSTTWQFPTVRVFQILNNLVSNSVKYCDFDKKERFVNIHIHEHTNMLKIVVQDNGTGIAYTQKEEVFKMFKRFHSKKIAGSGLGMYVLRKHLDALDGEIDFDTSSDGTTFTLLLPRLS